MGRITRKCRGSDDCRGNHFIDHFWNGFHLSEIYGKGLRIDL